MSALFGDSRCVGGVGRLHGDSLALGLSGLLVCLPLAAADLSGDCTVSVLNRSIEMKLDGTWVLPNVPANVGRVRVRATCVEDGVTRSGQSDFFEVPANGIVDVPEIHFDAPSPVPSKLILSAPVATLGSVGARVQLTTTAVYPDGSTAEVTGVAQGTNYTSSNPAIASVTADGLVTAHSGGTVIVSALHDGANALLRLSVVLSGDTDGDGLPDDVESANGMNPNDPVDALEDFDRDGLTNKQELVDYGTDLRDADTDDDTLTDGREVTLGTSPVVFDTDGDGVGDGLEVECASDPLSPASAGLACALLAIDVRPTSVTLIVNTIVGEASRQLRVTGQLRDGNALDLTSRARGTTYTSSDLQVVNFGAVDGELFAGQDGTASVTVRNAGLSALVPVAVQTFAPRALSSLAIPGGARRVDVSGDFACFAAGAAGLRVADVGDRLHPRIAASLALPGEAQDVRVVGTLAFVAAGSAGLQIVDVSVPLAPALLGGLDTPGQAQDVAVRGSIAFIADGAGGLQIADVSNPMAPVLLGSYAAPAAALGVDVSGGLAVVAYGGSGIRVIDVSNAANPVALGSLGTTNALDVVAEGTTAYVADFTGSLRTVDFSTPSAPRSLAQTSGALGGFLLSLAKLRQFTFGADIFFVNGVPITDVSDPSNPRVRARLDFPGDATGTGIAVDNQFVYLVADGVLYIGQYQIAEDNAGIAPTVRFTSPSDGQSAIEGSSLLASVEATDDVMIVGVTLQVNDEVVLRATTPPYEFAFSVPAGVGTLAFDATAVDLAGNEGRAPTVTVNVLPDNQAPAVTLTAPAAVVEGTTFEVLATATDDVAVAKLQFLVDGRLFATFTQPPYRLDYVAVAVPSVTFGARAVDPAGNLGGAPDALVTVQRDDSIPVAPPNEAASAAVSVANSFVPDRAGPAPAEARSDAVSVRNVFAPDRAGPAPAEAVGPFVSVRNLFLPERAGTDPMETSGAVFSLRNLVLPGVTGGEPREASGLAVSIRNLALPTVMGVEAGEAAGSVFSVKNLAGGGAHLATGPPGALQFDSLAFAASEGPSAARITVTRADGSNGTVTVRYATVDGTATSPADYQDRSGLLVFATGETARAFEVPIVDDALAEDTESVTLVLTDPTGGATLGSATSAVLHISDNEATPTLSIEGATVTEGDVGATPALFTVSLSGPSQRAVTVDFATQALTASGGIDYGDTSGRLTFPAGTTTQAIGVPVRGDARAEADETFLVRLSSSSNAVLGNRDGVGTIVNDDPPPPCVAPAAGLVARWPADGNAVNAVDGTEGTLRNSVAFEPGMIGQAFVFDGLDDHVELADTGLPADAAPRSLEFWARTFADAGIPVVYGGYAPGDAFYVVIRGRNACIGQWGGGPLQACGSRDVTEGEWHHVALTYDGGSDVRLYVDGALETAASRSYSTTATGKLYFGSPVGRSPDFYRGLLDEITLYDRPLTPAEVEGIFEAGIAGKCP